MTDFRIVSANLATGKADAGGFRDLIKRLRPDVVAVQELVHEQAVALAEALPFGKLRPSPDAMGMGIALRYPGVVTHIPLPYRGAWAAEIAGTSRATGPVEVLNVHLAAPHLLPPWRTLAMRRAQVRALQAHIDAAPHRHRVVVGDLNSTPIWPAYCRLTRGLDDAVRTLARHRGHRPARTWRPAKSLPFLLRIDHVLTLGLTVHEVHVIPIRGSDHGAVVADLSVDT